MNIPNLRQPSAHLSEGEAIRRVEQLRRTLPKVESKPPRGLDFQNFRRDWDKMMKRENS